jgi:hypothetical protein
MKSRYMIAVGAVVLAAVATAQPPVPSPPPVPVAPLVSDRAPVPRGGKTLVSERKPEDMTLEQLLDAVDGFRAQKAELEKKEKAYMKVAHQKAGKLKERIDGLDGVVPPPMAPSIVPGIPAPGSVPPAFPPAPMP